MKSFFKGLLLIVFFGVVSYTVYYFYNNSVEDPIVYKTEASATNDVIKKTVATGSIVPRKEIDIKPQVSGIIEKLYVEAGDMVVEGDLIAKVKVIPDMVNLNNAENRMRRAELTMENAKRDFNRNEKLFQQKIIAESEFQKTELDYLNAIEEKEAAETNLQIVKEGVSGKSGKTSNTLIRATATGMILDVPVEVGNQVIESNTFNEGTSIAMVADMGDMIFKGKVDESEVGKISKGMELLLSIGAIQDQKFTAILDYISPKGVAENGAIQFEIKANVTLDTDFFIRAGYSANADIVLDKREQVLTINESLLKFDGKQAYVEIEVGEQQFERRDVELGLSDGIRVEVLSGISEEDRIKKG